MRLQWDSQVIIKKLSEQVSIFYFFVLTIIIKLIYIELKPSSRPVKIK